MKDLSDDKLLEIANSKAKQKRKRNTKSVENFISKLGITAGKVKVPTYKIFYEYRIAKHESRDKKLSKIEFFRAFNVFFKSRRDGVTRYYLLNESFSVDKQSLLTAQRYDRMYKRLSNKKLEVLNEEK